MRTTAVALLGGLFLTISTSPVLADAKAEYRCVADQNCQQRWWRVMSWLEQNAKFKAVQRGENTIEASSRSPAHKNRLQYRVIRQQQANGDWLIEGQASCRASLGCPSADKRLADLMAYLAEPVSVQNSTQDRVINMNADKPKSLIKGDGFTPIERHRQAEQCSDQSQIHALRHSWAGALFEIECVKLERNYPESLVVRCRGEQCKTLH